MLEIDAKNRPVGTQSYQPPQPGSDIQLNIDINVQMKAEEALREQLNVVRGGSQRDNFGVHRKNAPAGASVVTDPNNGAVIALATFPGYDPAEFVNGISQERYAQLSDTDGISALIDRTITGQYAPGSTFKLVTATAALDNGKVSPGETINDTGVFEVGGQEFGSTGKNGFISMSRALTVSSDVYFYTLGFRMDGTTMIQDTAAAFGFDAATGIDLPNEAVRVRVHPRREEGPAREVPGGLPRRHLLVHRRQRAARHRPERRGRHPGAAGRRLLGPGQRRHRLPAPRGGPDHDAEQHAPPLDTDPTDVVRVIDPVVRSTVPLPDEQPRPRSSTASPRSPAAAPRRAPSPASTRPTSPSSARPAPPRSTTRPTPRCSRRTRPAGGPRYTVVAVLEESGFGSEGAAPVAKHIFELLDGQPQTPLQLRGPEQGRLMLPRSISRHDSRRSRRDPTAPLRHLDPVLLVCSLALGLIGVVSVYSATRGPGPDYVDSYLLRQFAFVVIGAGVMGVFALVDYHKLHDWAWLFYGATTALLFLVISPLGSQSKGAQAWFAVGPFQLQPAEFAKLSLIGALAFLLSEFKGDIDLRRLAALLAVRRWCRWG